MSSKVKKIIISILLLFLILGGVFIKFLVSESADITGGKFLSIKDDSLEFNCLRFKRYVHISLNISEVDNFRDNIEYQVIDPKRNIVESGYLKLNDKKDIFCKGNYGDWKVIFKFKNNNEKILVDYKIIMNNIKK